jgi:hypothetical protein
MNRQQNRLNVATLDRQTAERAELVDELTALSLRTGSASGVPDRLAAKAAKDEITVSEWLHDRVVTRAGMVEHPAEGLALHAASPAELVVPLSRFQLGHGGHWEW